MRPEVAQQQYCYLTTKGRRTGNPHTVEIWFGLEGETLYILAGNGERADFVRNLRAEPEVQVRIDGQTYDASGRVVTDAAEDQMARRLLLEKYQPGYGSDLSSWGQTALPVAIDLHIEAWTGS
jgi:deazaflavin-dependent oxidoreductase (nitroreductase family)